MSSEKEKWFNELLKKREWITENEAHFKDSGKNLYDEKNFDRMKRFVDAPMGYIDERIELNKEVSKNYHKFYTTILLAGFTAFYAVLLTNALISLVNTTEITLFWLNIALLVSLIVSAIVATKIRLTYTFMKLVGLLKVIRDSEIEIYYLTQIKEHRESVKENKKT